MFYVDGLSKHFVHAHLLGLLPLPFQQIIVADKQLPELTWLLPQQHRTGAAEDIHKAVVVRWEHAIENRQQVRLVADAGDW